MKEHKALYKNNSKIINHDDRILNINVRKYDFNEREGTSKSNDHA